MELRRYLDPRATWRDTSEVDKVRLYTVQSFVALIVLTGIASVADSIAHDAWLSAVAITVAAAAATLALLRVPGVGGRLSGDVRWPIAVSVAAGFLAGATGSGAVAMWALLIAAVPVTAVLTFRWSFALGVVIGGATTMTRYGVPGAVAAFVAVVLMAAIMRLSIWLLGVVTELDSSRHAAGQLSVAEERLRFSRDLHDVVGRALAAIAVKSELAAALSRRGDDRAADQMDEVRDLAQQAMTDARRLVRGYRSIDLQAEIDGASSLLSAAGIETTVVGSPTTVGPEFAEAAAWIVREGATNILRHSDATRCRVDITGDSLRIVNDRPHPHRSTDGTGLAGLTERLAAVGGSLATHSTADEYSLTATFTPRVDS
ncbi:MAG: histidine kinase [Rhodococcus sp. (in: high G+C Gram-positive bacteria)]